MGSPVAGVARGSIHPRPSLRVTINELGKTQAGPSFTFTDNLHEFAALNDPSVVYSHVSRHVIEFVQALISRLVSALAGLYHSPLALPIVVALIWRAYARSFTFTSVWGSFCVAALVMYFWPRAVPDLCR